MQLRTRAFSSRRDSPLRPPLALATITSAAVIGLGLAACGGDGDDSGSTQASDSSGPALTIGASVPLSGALESVGPAGQKAAQLATDQLQQASAAAGAKYGVSLVVEDNESDPQAAVEAAQRLDDAGATCIDGAWASADTLTTAQSVAVPQGILEISPASSADGLSTLDDKGLLARTVAPDSTQGAVLAFAIANDLGGAKGNVVNVGARDDSYGEGIADLFTKAWTGLGGSIGERVDYKPGAATSGDAEQITAGNPDAILIADRTDSFPQLGALLAKTKGWDPTRAWGPDGLAASALLDDPGPDVVVGMRTTAVGATENEPATQAFHKLFADSDPTDVTSTRFDAQSFDAVVLCYLAAAAAGSTDGSEMAAKLEAVSGPPGKKFTWQQLPDAIKAAEAGQDIDYVGASGPIDLDSSGDPTAGAYALYELTANGLKSQGSVPFDTSK